MRRTLIIKVGGTLEKLVEKQGDFEDWILTGMRVDPADALVVEVFEGKELPEYDQFSSVVITGSHSMVTERLDWSERTAAWLPGVVERQMPVLGICYGHQLLAHALGGEVADCPTGPEYGTLEVYLETESQEDALFGGLPSPFKAHVTHRQSVVKLPPNAKRLAWSKKDANQAFVVGGSAWGVQFHPEFNVEATRTYIDTYRDSAASGGADPDKLIAECEPTDLASGLLARFAEWVRTR